MKGDLTGNRKKQAKPRPLAVMAPLPLGTLPENTVGALQELCVKKGHPIPTYDEGAVGWQSHSHLPYFSIACVVGNLRETGAGGSKKNAKREAALKMIKKVEK